MKKPEFRIGFELEGLVREGHQSAFDEGLENIQGDIDRGTDGSVNGNFSTSGAWGGFSVDGKGIEIRTPVLPLDEGLELFDKILLYLGNEEEEGRFKTNTTCGLHVNLSEKRMVENHLRFCRFYAHLVSHFPERDVLKIFSRQQNTYCRPLFATRGQAKADYLELMALASRSTFGRNKYHSVGLHSDHTDGTAAKEVRRVEFRCLGNENYHKNFEKLHTAVDLIIDSATHAFSSVLTEPKQGERLRALIKKYEEEEDASGEDARMPTYVACHDF